jgi:hypothetical protein
VEAGGDEGRYGFFEVEGVDFIECQVPVLESVEEFGVGAATGTKGFKRESVTTCLTKVREQKSGQDGLANGRVCAGDEDDSRAHVPEVLTTDFTDGTDKKRET